MVDLTYERFQWSRGFQVVAGVDEAGRGPLAGPVVAAAVIMPRETIIRGVDDSKRLSPALRMELAALILARARAVGIGVVNHHVIDDINILQATMRAMENAVANLAIPPNYLLIDGPRYHSSVIPYTAVVDGDAKCFSIAAASIIAKVTRDHMMLEYDRQFPLYGFARHKGYGTREHLEAIRRYGPCEIHRRSFRMPEKLDTK